MVEFPPNISHTTAETVKRLFHHKTNREWHELGFMNIKVKEEPYQAQGRTYISHNIVFELFDQDLKHITSIKEKEIRKYRRTRQKQKT